MGEERIETGVDSLVRLLEDGKKHFLEDVAKTLDISTEVLKLWVDFLVEEKVITVEYSFTKPFIFLTKNKKTKSQIEEEKYSFEGFKKTFEDKAHAKKIPDSDIKKYWHNHLINILSKLKDFFIREAKKRNLKDPEKLWVEYNNKIMEV